jgi:hypothetical protein
MKENSSFLEIKMEFDFLKMDKNKCPIFKSEKGPY